MVQLQLQHQPAGARQGRQRRGRIGFQFHSISSTDGCSAVHARDRTPAERGRTDTWGVTRPLPRWAPPPSYSPVICILISSTRCCTALLLYKRRSTRIGSISTPLVNHTLQRLRCLAWCCSSSMSRMSTTPLIFQRISIKHADDVYHMMTSTVAKQKFFKHVGASVRTTGPVARVGTA